MFIKFYAYWIHLSHWGSVFSCRSSEAWPGIPFGLLSVPSRIYVWFRVAGHLVLRSVLNADVLPIGPNAE